MGKQLDSYVGQYFKSSATSYFKVDYITKGIIGEKAVLSIRGVSYRIFTGRLCIDYNHHQVQELDFDFESIHTSKEGLLSFIEKYI